MNRAEMIADLVTDKFSGFKDGDEKLLDAASDARLAEFRAASTARKSDLSAHTSLETEHRNVSARLTVAEGRIKTLEAELSEEEFLQKAPPRFKALIEGAQAAEAAEKTSIVTQLKDLGAHTAEELNNMGLEQLRVLASYARIKVPDFSGRGLPRDPNSREMRNNASYAAPDPYKAALEARRKTESVSH